ncbi:MAG TPA: hypothetical protein VGO34_14750 [Alphaproteobacteria bacterium]|jgi:hypothetical protein
MIFHRRTPYLDRRLGMPLAGRVLCASLGVTAAVILLAAAGAGLIRASVGGL